MNNNIYFKMVLFVFISLFQGSGTMGANVPGVLISTVPEFADIYMDGTFYGISPLSIENVSEGEHMFEIRHPIAGILKKKIIVNKKGNTIDLTYPGVIRGNASGKGLSGVKKFNDGYKKQNEWVIKKTKKIKNKYLYGAAGVAALIAGILYGKKKIDDSGGSVVVIKVRPPFL